ncbi:WXG100 family type VII secretion target [uncultured Microbacterium sp.]|uniref:WXG100 family type VII secretion target n=1 Tax=uncultured Microbacterium sp. TaxID=191216 RepID=UPI0025D8B65F|nr:WXG100 family type VII secretion target [uncultured Microbacterium sp.]
MSDFRVTPESLHAAAARLRSESARIDSTLSGLDSEVARLRGQWEGAAQTAYNNAQQQWSATLEQMRDVLQRISNATDSIADDYVSADRASAARFH